MTSYAPDRLTTDAAIVRRVRKLFAKRPDLNVLAAWTDHEECAHDYGEDRCRVILSTMRAYESAVSDWQSADEDDCILIVGRDEAGSDPDDWEWYR